MTRTLRTLAAVVVACALAAGCGSDKTIEPLTMSSVAGTYNLATYNGLALPAIVQAANPKVEVLDDQVIVRSDGTWSEVGHFRITNAAGINVQVETGSGTYTLNGSAAAFRESTDGSVINVVFAGDSFSLVGTGATSVYTR